MNRFRIWTLQFSKAALFAVAVLLPLFHSPSLRAQAISATLLGTVTDASGGVVPGAAITATEVNTGTVRHGSTGSAGTYSIPYLPPGSYTVEITAQGFKSFIRENVELAVDTSVRVDAALQVGAVSESVKVTGEPPLLQTDRAEIGRVFNSDTVRELPFVDRTPEAVVGLLPGVYPPTVAESAGEGPQDITTYRANGTTSQADHTEVDGIDDHDPLRSFTIYIPQMEDVQEVSVTTSNYDAEFGSVGGGMVKIVTRGGTNQLHGSLFEFWRGSDLAARNFFNPVGSTKATFNRNEFGTAIGGPIKKDKTFFFFAWQGRYLVQGAPSTTTVPVPAWRMGNLSGTPSLSLYDPTTGNADGTGRQPFPNDTVPTSRINPIATKILSMLVSPNVAGFANNLTGILTTRLNGNSYDGRIDQNFSEMTRMFVKFNYAPFSSSENSLLGPVLGSAGGGFCPACTTTNDNLMANIHVTHGFSSTLLTELRLGFTRSNANVENANNSAQENDQFGIANPDPEYYSEHGLAAIGIDGMASLGGGLILPLVAVNNQFQLANTWNKVMSKHTLKWGVDFRQFRMSRLSAQGLNLGPRGYFQFYPGPTELNGGPAPGPYTTIGNSFASFLLGDPNESSRTYLTVTPYNEFSEYMSFVNDVFQVTPRLTLNMGLRYEVYTPIVPRSPGGAANYDPFNDTLLVAGVGSVGLNTGVQTDYKNFEPRFGIAYRLNNKTVIRTGYGLSYFLEANGFAGGTLSTVFPVLYNVQVGTTGTYQIAGSLNSLPTVPFASIPSSGIFNPSPDQAFYYVPFHNPTPHTHAYNFTVEREFGWGIVGNIGYVGNDSRDLAFAPALNTAAPGTELNGRALYAKFGINSSIIERGYGLSGNYNSLQTSAKKQFGNGLMFSAAFTYGKAMGYGNNGDQDGNNQTGFQNNLNFHTQYAPTTYDQKYVFVASHLYELPFGKGKRWLNKNGPLDYVLGGWQLNGILTLATGTPFTITADATSCNCPGNTQVADALMPVTVLGGVGPGQHWFDPTDFGNPAPNRFGTVGLDTVRGPAMHNYNMSIFKTFPVKELAKIEFRTEFFNLTNTPLFANPAAALGSGNFAQISSASNQRNIEFAMRVLF